MAMRHAAQDEQRQVVCCGRTAAEALGRTHDMVDDRVGARGRTLADDGLAGGVGAVLPLLGQAPDRLAIKARQQRGRGKG